MSALDLEDLQHFLLTRTPALAALYEFLSFPDAAKGAPGFRPWPREVGSAHAVGEHAPTRAG
jgi:hypothetical protein